MFAGLHKLREYLYNSVTVEATTFFDKIELFDGLQAEKVSSFQFSVSRGAGLRKRLKPLKSLMRR
jgi:hypothetical protein